MSVPDIFNEQLADSEVSRILKARERNKMHLLKNDEGKIYRVVESEVVVTREELQKDVDRLTAELESSKELLSQYDSLSGATPEQSTPQIQ